MCGEDEEKYAKYLKYCFLINDAKSHEELDEILVLINNDLRNLGRRDELKNYIEIKKSILNSRNTIYDDSELIDNQFYYVYSSDDQKLAISVVDDSCNNVSPKVISVIARAYEGKLYDIISGYNIKISLNPMIAYTSSGFVLADHAVRIIDKEELEKIVLMICNISKDEKVNFKQQLNSMTGNWMRIILEKGEK